MRLIIKITGIDSLTRTEFGYILIYLVTFVPLIYKFVTPFLILTGLGKLGVFVTPSMLWIGVCFVFGNLKEYIDTKYIIGFLLFAILVLIYGIVNQKNDSFFDENYIPFITKIAPFFFIGLSIDPIQREDILAFIAKTGILVQTFWLFCQLSGLAKVELAADGSLGEQMRQSYDFLVSVLLQFMVTIKKKNMINLIFLVLGVFIVFLLGTRGPVIILSIYICLYALFIHQYEERGVFKRVLTIIALALLYTFLDVIIMVFMPFAEMLGFSTRVFDSILGQRIVDINESSGRDAFYECIINAIRSDNSMLGYGWGGDRLFTPTGAYAHNFILEILCQFGVIIGGLLLIWLIIIFIKSFIISKRNSSESFWLVLFCAGFIELQLSQTYINHALFFVMIGYMLNCLNHKFSTN